MNAPWISLTTVSIVVPALIVMNYHLVQISCPNNCVTHCPGHPTVITAVPVMQTTQHSLQQQRAQPLHLQQQLYPHHPILLHHHQHQIVLIVHVHPIEMLLMDICLMMSPNIVAHVTFTNGQRIPLVS